MHTSASLSPHDRNSGKTAWWIALALAGVFCAAILGYLFFQGPLEKAPPESETPAVAGLAPEKSPTEASPASPPPQPAPGAAPPPAEPSPAPAEPIAAKGEVAPRLRIFGSIADSEHQPIAQALVRWIPANASDLRFFSHDEALFAKELDLSRFPEGKLRRALEKSRLASSGEDGKYELEVPLVEESEAAGVVAAFSPGHEAALQEVKPGDPSESPEAASAPEPALPEPAASKIGAARESRHDFKLQGAGSISGKVTDAETGEPAAGVAVAAGLLQADRPEFLAMVDERAPSAVAGASGAYSLMGLAAGEYRVVPRTGLSDYASLASSQGKKVAVAAGAEVAGVDFRVSRGGRIVVRVAGPNQEPVAGARCLTLPEDMMASQMKGDAEAFSLWTNRQHAADAEGKCEVRGLPLGKSFQVTAMKDGLAPASVRRVKLTAEAPEVEVRIELARGSTISGLVILKNGAPAAGAEVQIVPNVGDMLSGKVDFALLSGGRAATADAQGAFALPNLPAGEYDLRAGKLDPSWVFGGKERQQPIAVDGVQDIAGVQLVLNNGDEGVKGEIAGLVVDDLGKPVAGSSVQVTGPRQLLGGSSTTVQTDESGKFSAEAQGAGPFKVEASKSAYSRAAIENVAPGARDLMLILLRPGRVSGKVVAAGGAAIGSGGKVKAVPVKEGAAAGAMERLMAFARQDFGSQESPIDDQGRFSVEAPAGMVQIAARVPGFAPAVSKTVSVSPGEEAGGLEIRISAGAAVSGRVVAAGNKSIAGAAVTLRPVSGDASIDLMREMLPQFLDTESSKASTEEDGTYEIRHLAPGEYVLAASHKEFAPSDPVTISLKADQAWEAPALYLSSGGVIAGKVKELEKPKAGILVQVLGGGPLQQSMTGEDGQFEFRGLKPGEYLLQFMDMAGMQKGKMALKTRDVVLAGEERQEVEVVFGAGFKVLGKIDGLPPGPMHMITLRKPGGPKPEDLNPLDMKSGVAAGKYQAGMAMVPGDGKYEIADLEPGEYILEVLTIPANAADPAALAKMDRTPSFRKEITVGKKDLEVDIRIK